MGYVLLQLQGYLREDVIDQIAPLIELKRWLSYLNISPSMQSSSTNSTNTVHIELIPQVYMCRYSVTFIIVYQLAQLYIE